MKRLIDSDPITGMRTYHSYDHKSRVTYIEEVQDMEPHINLMKELQKDESYSKKGIKNSWWHGAHFPNVIINKWLIDYGIDIFNKDHLPAVKRKLQDPEWRYLKATTGNLGK